MMNRHIPAIDGLRAVSVAAVVVYHSELTASGGFLAVSQFFTLSGFLVTSILLRRAADEELDVVRFWGRRYRRLIPASMLTLAAVVVFGFLLATEQQVEGLRESIPAALFQVVNWHFIVADVSYVDQFSSPSPIQHFWSLAIEEQFYLAMPLVLVGLFAMRMSPRLLLLTMLGASIASTAWMYRLFDTGASLNRVYFGTDARVSEMLLGSALAVLLFYWRPELSDRGRTVLGSLGVAAFALTTWAFFGIELEDPALYQGGFLLYSVLTCVVLYGLVEGTGPVHRILATGPLPSIGRLTYAIYLFHWPLMLWLTEDRVGVGGWSLLSLQAALTVALAAVSGKYFEGPIRYGRAAPGDRRLPMAIIGSGVLIALAAVALRWNDVQTDLAGLGESIGPAPTAESDEPITVAVVGDERGLTFAMNDLATATALDDRLQIVASLPFSCTSVDATDCGSWLEWQKLVEEHDPDVVLVHVSGWGRADIAARASSDDASTLEAWATASLDGGLDYLTGHGATVVWGRSEVSMSDALRAANDPFILAMTDLSNRRADVRRLGVAVDAERVAADLELYGRVSSDELPRVLVVGDSVSRTVGYGLERWSSDTESALTWSAGIEGCGIATGGVFVDASGREIGQSAICDTVAAGWEDQISQFAPDRIIVISNVADFRARRLDSWPAPLVPGDDRFDDYLVEQYVAAYDALSAGGAVITWVIPPCAVDVFGILDEPDGRNPVDLDRIQWVGEQILPRVVERRPELQLFDLYSEICPADEPITTAPGVDDLRPDGVHFSPQGSLWLAETIGADLIGLTEK